MPLCSFAFLIPLFICFATGRGKQIGCIPVNASGVPVEPARMLGRWYAFAHDKSQYDPDEISVTYDYTPIARRPPPNQRDIVIKSTWSVQGKLPNGTIGCGGYFDVSTVDRKGQRTGVLFFPTETGFGSDYTRLTTLFTDYRTMEIFYQCADPTAANGLCPHPYLYVTTRQPPNQLNGKQRKYIIGKMKTVLKKYCMSNKDMALLNYRPAPQVCTPEPPPEFAETIRAAVRRNARR